nr:flagellar export chaperone FliS [Paeniclostridium sordellii]
MSEGRFMYTANPYNAYKQNSVNTASKEKLLIMLVDGAVKYTKIARMAILEKNIEKAHKELTRVQDIFLELMITMDKDSNKFMQDLYNVYDFIKNQLAMANIKKDVKIIDNILPLIEEIRDMWHEVDKKIKSGK